MFTFTNPRTLPPQYAQWIGIIAATWSMVEFGLVKAIAELTDVGLGESAFLLSNVGYRSRVDLLQCFRDLASEIDKDEAKKFGRILAQIDEAYGVRNRFVHSYWIVEPGKIPRIASLRTKGKIKIEDQPIELKELESAANQIWKAGADFREYLQGHSLLQ